MRKQFVSKITGGIKYLECPEKALCILQIRLQLLQNDGKPAQPNRMAALFFEPYYNNWFV